MLKKLLIANRGEIAIRIARTAAELGIASVAIYSDDDAESLHVGSTDQSVRLSGSGPAAYLDSAQVIAAARETGCDAIHPGYGFLSENAAFARACEAAGLIFVGPPPHALDLFGDKAAARALAQKVGIPVLPGTSGPTSEAEAAAFFAGLGASAAVMIKAIAGGGGRGMRIVTQAADLPAAFALCRSEAERAFGNGALYVEQYLPQARHVEVQIVGDGTAISHLWDRECSLQRQNQKIVEFAPAVGPSDSLRQDLLKAATALASAVSFRGLATVEFLVALDGTSATPFAFMETNPRLQVEHTVTEQVTGLDLVALQLRIAGGETLADLHLTQSEVPAPRGTAVQLRINMETMAADGTARPAGGLIAVYEMPSGPGIRVDGFGYAGYRTSVRFDSLLAKLIVHAGSSDVAGAVGKARRALRETRIAGVATNIGFLLSLLAHPDVAAGRVYTRFVDDHLADLLNGVGEAQGTGVSDAQRAGVKIDAVDPLAVLSVARSAALPEPEDADTDADAAVRAPLQGTIVSLGVAVGDTVRVGQPVLVMEAMKMEHVVEAEIGGVVARLCIAPGDTVFEGARLIVIAAADTEALGDVGEQQIDLDAIRPDLAELIARRRFIDDEGRPQAVAKRHSKNLRTTRENIDDLCDPGSFVEYGSLVVAGRLRRNSMEELIERTPADGFVMGLGRVNGAKFGDEQARVIAMSYDYTVLAGTQGLRNHQKKDRILRLAEQWRLPVVFFTEGGGGRPGDTDAISAGGMTNTTFLMYARLSGLVPLVGINSGYCFAGNAALLGCCDVIIATKNSSIGMGGPAMIEGGGLGVFHPQDVGPVSVQAPNGVIDVVVDDEAAAVAAAKQYLSYFQGPVTEWECTDQRNLRNAVPENRLRVYDVRAVIDGLADTGSVLELRRQFGVGMITAFARVEGRPIGIIANNPKHLSGAIDRDGSDKAARFMQLCDAFDIPLLMLCDTPGNMVGPEAEKTGLVRHNSRLFIIGANITVPVFTVILRKCYGLGAMGMAGASLHAPVFTVSWPSGEIGGMGLEGSVKLGYRDELAAIADPAERKAKYDAMVAEAYQRGKALNAAALFEFDEVIDPADTRRWISAGLRSVPVPPKRQGKKLPWIDAW
ncbi:Acetyl-coenzyme A carboxylase carboxyl transferase subunit alpha [Alphaproteobacteria bacterium SO-S41]|nr:Acetyl-coenzyme A carboxylase carboxyl transferase subunit alpha [Alphaproteobacteria bacterium SO-S41]